MKRHIIFDFGGVLLDLDPEATWSALKSCLDLPSLEDLALQQVLIDYEVGRIEESSFFLQLKGFSRKEVSDSQLLDAWNAMLGPLPSHRLTMLRELSKRYQLHLLSNTNKSHIDYIYNYLKSEYDINAFGEAYFTSHYYSHLIHMRKPDREIYEYVISDIGASPDHVLFIDDNKDNISSACDLGIIGIRHDPTLDISHMIGDYLSRSK